MKYLGARYESWLAQLFYAMLEAQELGYYTKYILWQYITQTIHFYIWTNLDSLCYSDIFDIMF